MRMSSLWILVVMSVPLGLVPFIPGCDSGGTSIKIELPDGPTVPAGGSIQIVAVVRDDGIAEDGTEVSFSTDVGSFEPYDKDDIIDPITATTAETTAGKAIVKIYSFPGHGGSGKVEASFTSMREISLSTSANISVAVPAKASGAHFSAQCDSVNVSVFGNPNRGNMRIKCVAHVKDIQGNPVENAEVKAVGESGCTMNLMPDEEDGPGIYVFSLNPACDPIDVGPLPLEPKHQAQDAKIHNPRDGLLTLLFYVQGEEGYVDRNGNGQYDEDESFAGFDLSEPCLDADDDNNADDVHCDPGETIPGTLGTNNKWDKSNGVWDENTTIWTTTRILFTGGPDSNTTKFSPTGVSINNGSSQQLTLSLMDINHNPLAANSDRDNLSFEVTNADLDNSTVRLIRNTLGVEFTSTGNVDQQSFTRNRSYTFTLSDSDPDTLESPALVVTLQTTVTWTSAPDFDTYSADEQSKTLDPVTGTSL
jgi:hypothetical protein